MVFKSITNNEIEVGKPLKATLAARIKENLDDLNTRVTATGTVVREIFNDLAIGFFLDQTTIGSYRTIGDTIPTEAFVAIVDTFTDDAANNLEIDILKGAGPDIDAATTIFATRPTVAAEKGGVSIGSAFIDGLSVSPGDYFFLQVIAFRANIKAFQIILR